MQQEPRGRLVANGVRTHDASRCRLVVTHDGDGSWVIDGLGEPALRLAGLDMVALAEAILARAR